MEDRCIPRLSPFSLSSSTNKTTTLSVLIYHVCWIYGPVMNSQRCNPEIYGLQVAGERKDPSPSRHRRIVAAEQLWSLTKLMDKGEYSALKRRLIVAGYERIVSEHLSCWLPGAEEEEENEKTEMSANRIWHWVIIWWIDSLVLFALFDEEQRDRSHY